MTTSDQYLRLGPDFYADPHADYAWMREERPTSRVITPLGNPVWLVTRYDDVRAALAHPRLHKSNRELRELLEARPSEDRTISEDALTAHMLSADPPDHTRLRKLVSKAFTGRAIAALRPRIEEITTELLDAMEAGPDRVDLLDTFAFPLPITVICELLGVPMDDRDDFRRWSNTLLQSGDAEVHAAAGLSMVQYLTDLVDARREHPTDDMLGAIVAASEDSDQLSRLEAISMAFLLLVAGHETTVNLIGTGTFALLRHPSQFEILRSDPSLVPSAVEEFLRWDGPVHLATIRFTVEPTVIGGVEIPPGEIVLVSLSAANRDPKRYPDADALDVRRQANSHLAFGHGIHHCLGAPLARLEGEVAFTQLLSRFPGLALDADPAELTWRPSTLIRGLERLPVRLR
ncbi:cytochrome P450 family protein [Cryptosporangium aurantiacum]|uniref:Cytochrome P450 n=1 Tax=Cryptosporangium aurantiacum TaxID=134849 RepID=A0A1M7PTU8_9ACTN|nr:cytochrome P450 [Cryptosporangium aurantiacum]SHN20852.1 Cytochrome P450 [Cryptosporangium aurantiacum]